MIAEGGVAKAGAPLWAALRALAPEQVCDAAGVRVHPSEGEYTVSFLGAPYQVSSRRELILGPGGQARPVGSDEELLLLAYLVNAKNVPFAGRWVSASALPGGAMFFRGPHALPLGPLVDRFGADPPSFLRAGIALGGNRLSFADASVELTVLPRIVAAPLLWACDDEFPARATMLFDASLGSILPLDVVLALTGVVVRRIVEAALA